MSYLITLVIQRSEFFELGILAAHDLYPKERVPSAAIVMGIGKIHGVEVMIAANDPTIKVLPLLVLFVFVFYLYFFLSREEHTILVLLRNI